MPAFLAADGVVVHVEGNRRGSRVLTAFESLAGAGDACAGDGIGICAFAQPALRGFDLDQFFRLERLQNLVGDARERQGDLLRDLEAVHVALKIQDLQGQVLQPQERKTGILHAVQDGRIERRIGNHGFPFS